MAAHWSKLLIRCNENMGSDWLLAGIFEEIKLCPNPVKPISIRKAVTPGSGSPKNKKDPARITNPTIWTGIRNSVLDRSEGK